MSTENNFPLHKISYKTVLERYSEFPGYVFFWSKDDPTRREAYIVAVGPEYKHRWIGGGLTPWAIPKAVYDSAYAAMNPDSSGSDFYRTFLPADARSKRANIVTPGVDAEKIGEWCWQVKDVIRIDRLDSALFDVSLTQAIYYYLDGDTEIAKYGRGHWDRVKQQMVYKRPIPKSMQEWPRFVPYAVWASVSLAAIVIAVAIYFRRKQPSRNRSGENS